MVRQGRPPDAAGELRAMALLEPWRDVRVLRSQQDEEGSYAFVMHRRADMPEDECWFAMRAGWDNSGGGGGGCAPIDLDGEIASWAWNGAEPFRIEGLAGEGVEQLLVTYGDGSTEVLHTMAAQGYRLRGFSQLLTRRVDDVAKVTPIVT